MPKVKTKSIPPSVPCGYDCGRDSEGYLNVMFTEWQDAENSRAYQRGFSVNIPCCRPCLAKCATVSIHIPKVKT